jgi:hypothetical protein
MVNIVMLVRNRLKLTTQALNSLYEHTPQREFTLTVVDDDSDLLTSRMLNSLSYNNYSLLNVKHSGSVLSQLKNLGVHWTQQHFVHRKDAWLYISDNDVCFTAGWLQRITEVAQASETSRFRLWGGQCHPYHQLMPTTISGLDEAEVLDGPSWLMRWDTWNIYGPLDRTSAPGVCQSEEYPFCTRLRAARNRIGVVVPPVVIHTGLTNTFGQPAPGAEDRRKLIPEGVYTE